MSGSDVIAAPRAPAEEEGLLQNTADHDHDQDHDADHDPKPLGEPQPLGLFVWLLTLSAGISGLLFGYDTGVISATLVSIDTSLSHRALTSLDKSIITSSTALFALLASAVASGLADAHGRKRVILLADLLFVAGSLLQAASATVPSMVAGRAVVGAAVGAASFVVPMYIAELAPAAHRGRLVSLNIFFVTFGQVVAYLVGWTLAEHASRETGWRWMVGLGAVPAALQVVLVSSMPDTPRWLVKAGRPAEARAIIKKVAGNEDARNERLVNAILKDIEREVREEEGARPPRDGRPGRRPEWFQNLLELFRVRRNRRALAIACLLQGLQQLSGFNSLMYFSATIFTMLGFKTPTLTSLVVAVTNWLFTIAAILLIDRIGRRRILLYSLPLMVLGLLLAGYGFSFMDLSASDPRAAAAPASAQGAAVTVLISIMIYVGAYAIGMGCVPWMQSELFGLGVRSTGSGLATATNWGSNFVAGMTFLPMMDALTPTWTFVLYAVVCVLGLFLVWKRYPETSGLTLEEAAALLERDDWGVEQRPA